MLSRSRQGNIACLLCISIARVKSDSRGVGTVNTCSSVSEPNSLLLWSTPVGSLH